jgi:von Willebrand factor A domain-containing protein 7
MRVRTPNEIHPTRIESSAMLSLALAAVLLSSGIQQDQVARPIAKNARGMLPVNRMYFDLAANTGGDFYFWAPGEFVTSRLKVNVDHEAVLLSYGEIATKKVFEIPVEGGAAALTLFAGVQRKDLAVLVRPDGTVVRETDRGVALQPFQHMLIGAIASPVAGTWHLELTGEGTYAVTAHVKTGRSGLELVAFDFVELGGRPGHEGMFPIEGAPHKGEKVSFRVNLSGAVREARLDFVTKDGETIGTAPMTLSDDGDYSGQCIVPASPFRVAIRGTDAQGARFQRFESRMREPR